MILPEWSLTRPAAFDADFGRIGNHLDAGALNGRSVLLTGGTGFFGLWLVEYFEWLRRVAGVDVTVHVLTRDPGGALMRHPAWQDRSWLHLFQGDVRSFDPPADRIDYILHGATDTSAAAGRRPFELFDVIYGGARRVLEIAATTGCRRVLLVGSGAVYGVAASAGLIPETCMTAPDTMRPESALGEGKRACEALGTYMAKDASFDVVTARCFTFVGAGLPLNAHFAIGNFIRDAIEGRDMRLTSTGKSVRSYLYAADLALWLVALLLKGRAGTAYNVGSDREIEIGALAGLVRDVLSPDRKVEIADEAATAVRFYTPDISRARAELGLDAWTSLEEAVLRTAQDAVLFGPYRGMA